MKNKRTHPHEIEVHKYNPDWALILVCGMIIGFGLGLLICL